jgi:SHS2 domain-containing protein
MNEQPVPAGFVELDHTADRAILVWASTPAELFEQAALGMFALMADLTSVSVASRHELTIEVDDLESALVDWLNELLYWHETRQEVYSTFTVLLAEGRLQAQFAGGPVISMWAAVEAATFHNLVIQQDQAGVWRADIVFDT